jgi:hypothetical protein
LLQQVVTQLVLNRLVRRGQRNNLPTALIPD